MGEDVSECEELDRLKVGGSRTLSSIDSSIFGWTFRIPMKPNSQEHSDNMQIGIRWHGLQSPNDVLDHRSAP